MNKKIILFDIDYTLFDTTQYKKKIAEKLAEIINFVDSDKAYAVIEKVYYDVRSFGDFNPSLFADLFLKKFPDSLSKKAIEEIWWQKDILISALYPETVSVLQKLSKKENLLLGIFSSGKTDFQLAKISFFADLFHKDHLHITSFKEETVSSLMQEYKDQAVILVDDYIEILDKAKKMKSDLMTIWMKRGRFAEKARIPYGFEPDATIVTLGELLPIVDIEEND